MPVLSHGMGKKGSLLACVLLLACLLLLLLLLYCVAHPRP